MEASWGLFDILVEETDDRVRKILEGDVDETDEENPDFIVKTVYRQCLDQESMTQNGLSIVS